MEKRVGDRRRVWLNPDLRANAVNFMTLKGGFDAEYVGKTKPFNGHDGLEIETWRNSEGDVAHVVLAHDTDKGDVAGIMFFVDRNDDRKKFVALRAEYDDAHYHFHRNSNQLKDHVERIHETVMSVVEANVASRLLI